MEKPKYEIKSEWEKEKEEKVRYSIVLYGPRKRLGITAYEFMVADIIHRLGGGPQSRTLGGYCFASKSSIAEMMGINKKTVDRAVSSLASAGLIEKHPSQKALVRTTAKWFNEVELEREKIGRKR